jgi:preprotein translocase subunit SecA
VTRAIGRAQKRVEAHNFDLREHLLKYDDVMNKQREVIYANRLDALRGTDLKEEIRTMVQSYVGDAFTATIDAAAWNDDEAPLEPLLVQLMQVFLRPFQAEEVRDMSWEMAREALINQGLNALDEREVLLGPELMRQLERYAYLRAIDDKWKDHLRELDHLRSSVGLRAWGQKDPLLEYKSEAFSMLEEMLKEIDKQTLYFVFHAQVSVRPPEVERARTEALTSIHGAPASAYAATAAAAPAPAPGRAVPAGPPLPPLPGGPAGAGSPYRAMRPGGAAPEPAKPVTVRHTVPKVGRNEVCPCGSGKKYKFCHGASE